MTIHQALLHALHGRQTWLQVADVIGLSPRTVRRWRARLERVRGAGLARSPPPDPVAPPGARWRELQRVLRLYRERYQGFNVRHFHQLARRDHGVTFSYTLVKTALQGAGLVPKGRARGPPPAPARAPPLFRGIAASRRQPPSLARPRPRRLAHPARRRRRCDEAAPLRPARGGRRIHPRDHAGALDRVRAPRAARAPSTRTAPTGPSTRPPRAARPDRTRLTQVGRALHALGIEHILGHSPQARGRSERANRTLQDRLVNELRLAGIRTVPAANRYLVERFLPAYNQTFGRPPADPAAAFVPVTPAQLEPILCHEEARVVARDNTVTLDRVVLQIGKQRGRRTCAGLPVLVRRHLDGRHSVWWGRRCLGRYDAAGRPLTLRPATASA